MARSDTPRASSSPLPSTPVHRGGRNWKCNTVALLWGVYHCRECRKHTRMCLLRLHHKKYTFKVNIHSEKFPQDNVSQLFDARLSIKFHLPPCSQYVISLYLAYVYLLPTWHTTKYENTYVNLREKICAYGKVLLLNMQKPYTRFLCTTLYKQYQTELR